MGQIAFVFPGQGAETPAMGLVLASHFLVAKRYLALASEQTGHDIPRLLRSGGRRLQSTAILQPTLTAVCLGALAKLQSLGLRADIVAGHSLGELSAWAVTGAITPARCIALAATRGQLMGVQAHQHPGAMVALSGIARADLDQLLDELQAQGPLAIAAHNGPTEWVLSGAEGALAAVAERWPVKQLSTSGPWHSALMTDALAPWRDALDALGPRERDGNSEDDVAFVANATGQLCPREEIPAALAGQLVAPIQWAQSTQTLLAEGVTDIVCVGPSRVMMSLLRHNVPRHVRLFRAEEQRPGDIEKNLAPLLHAAHESE